MAKKPANIEEDLLGGTATETAAPPAKPKPRKKVTKPAAEEEEDLIGKTVQKAKASASKVKAVPEKANGKAKAKAAKPAAEKTKRVVRAPRDDEQIEKVKAALLKQKKPISYADFATKLDAPIRMVRRMSRALVAEGQLELTKEGTIGYVRSIALA